MVKENKITFFAKNKYWINKSVNKTIKPILNLCGILNIPAVRANNANSATGNKLNSQMPTPKEKAKVVENVNVELFIEIKINIINIKINL